MEGAEVLKYAETDELALTGFLKDIKCLDALSDWTHGFNVFDVLGIARMEIRHSNMLAWLLDPNGAHGLGNGVIKALLVQIAQRDLGQLSMLDVLMMDYQDFNVLREHHNMDIFAFSDSARVALCIENKVGSGEHGIQLENYRAYVNERYGSRGFKAIFVYLTPNGDDSSDPEHWIPISYGEVLDAILEARGGTVISSEAVYLIEDYIEVVRRHIVGDDELRRVCEEIYRKHRRALDLIYENRPDLASELAEITVSWAEERAKSGQIEFNSADCTKTYTRFKTQAMTSLLPDSIEQNSDWKTRNHYFYEIENHDTSYRIKLSFSLNNMSDEQLVACKDIGACFGKELAGENRRWWSPFSTAKAETPEEIVEEEIFEQLDKWLEIIKEKEDKLIAQLGNKCQLV